MKSHPNYKGYDANEGKPNKIVRYRESVQIIPALGPLELKDLYCEIPSAWLAKVNAVRKWCEERDIDFCPSPYPYQIAKVMAGDFKIVLWSSKMKGSRQRYIKPAYEGPVDGAGAKEAMTAISSIVRH